MVTGRSFSYHCRKGIQSTCTMQFFTRVLVLTNSLLLALYTTSRIRHLRVIATCMSKDDTYSFIYILLIFYYQLCFHYRLHWTNWWYLVSSKITALLDNAQEAAMHLEGFIKWAREEFWKFHAMSTVPVVVYQYPKHFQPQATHFR